MSHSKAKVILRQDFDFSLIQRTGEAQDPTTTYVLQGEWLNRYAMEVSLKDWAFTQKTIAEFQGQEL